MNELLKKYFSFKGSLIFISVALLYIGIGLISLKLATVNDYASPIWSGSGLGVGALLIFGQWLAPAIFVGAFLTNLSVDSAILSSLGIATGNMLEAMLGAYIVSQLIKKQTFKQYTEFVSVIISAMIAPLVSATMGVTTLLLNNHTTTSDFLYAWYTWLSGDAVGIMVILPLFLEIYVLKKEKMHFQLSKFLGAVSATLLGLIVVYLVFVKNYNQAFVWMLCPLFILSGIYVGKISSRFALICLAFFIVTLTTLGHGPFEFGSLNLNLIYIQCLLASYAFSVLFVRPLATGFPIRKSFIISNIFGWAIIFVAIFITSKVEKNNLMEDLDDLSKSSLEEVRNEVTRYELLLDNSEALLKINPNLLSHEWQEYVESLNLSRNYPSIRGMAYIRSILKINEAAFIKEVRAKGVKDFEIRVLDKDYSAKFNDRYVITYLEPRLYNKTAQGIDIGSDPIRREAIETSRRLKKSISTEVVKPLEKEKKQLSFVVYHPVWSLQKEFKGWVTAPMNVDDFYKNALSPYDNLLNLKVSREGKLIFQKDQKETHRLNENYFRKMKLNMFGLDNDLIFSPTSEFFERHSHSSAPLALLLSVFMLFIAGFLLEQLTFSQRVESLITIRTKELEESKIKLINSSKMASLGEMASSMAHEINNPITIILGKMKVITFMLEDLGVNHKPLNDEIARIEHTTGRISKIVKGLKSFSRAAQDDPFDLIPVETIVHETLDLCAEKLKVTGVKLIIGSVPEICLYCRPSQISQVLLNLLNNSSDAVQGSVDKIITLDFELQEPDHLIISVSDSGAGIPSKIAHRIMEPFFTTKGVGKGTGLGLSIAKGIIEDHGGQIMLDEKSTQTRFIIELPIRTGEIFSS